MRNLFCLSSAIFAFWIGLTKANELQLRESNDIFRNKLDEILSEDTKENVVFSPFSLHTALSVLYLGSEGRTRKAFKDVMSLREPEETARDYESLLHSLALIKDVALEVATKLYVSHKVRLANEFESSALQHYSAEEESINFEDNNNAAATINKWVSKKTKNKITKIIDPKAINDLTVLVLVNAVYFKGNWLHKFSETIPDTFYGAGKNFKSEMMSISKGFSYSENKELDAQIVRLPYTDERFSLVVVLPKEKMGYVNLEKKLRKMDSSIFKDLKVRYGIVSLPKFQIEKEISLQAPLSRLGLNVIFSTAAEFRHIADMPIKVSEIKQKLFFKVDTNGTEAAAVTQAIGQTFSGRPEPNFVFVADHPFLFFLEYSSASGAHVLFQGRVTEV